ncbi:general secretion pathway protein C [Variovorax dokdonensis]|uniref:General secretion pathway protein C n=1 Tax=Variovorax dokdonensis TaxID=344883 RepID=A0ABT7NBN1_9BURK|nr:general secretion pathway protein C [Variovorax dokdonensis]MDM0045342.1 general secretion pathway protein C [Variovorax dokdonensis]
MSALSHTPARWPVALGTTAVWTLAAACLVYWGLKLAAPPDSMPPATPVAAALAVDTDDVSRVLGATGAAPAVAPGPDAGSRFVLLGVVADVDQQGAALIQIDGQPPRPFRVGQELGSGYVLQSLDKRAAALGARLDTPTLLTLRLPDPPTAPGIVIRGSQTQ